MWADSSTNQQQRRLSRTSSPRRGQYSSVFLKCSRCVSSATSFLNPQFASQTPKRLRNAAVDFPCLEEDKGFKSGFKLGLVGGARLQPGGCCGHLTSDLCHMSRNSSANQPKPDSLTRWLTSPRRRQSVDLKWRFSLALCLQSPTKLENRNLMLGWTDALPEG